MLTPVYLGISAWLANRGFSLPYAGMKQSLAEIEYDKLATEGNLFYYKQYDPRVR
jgi:hypothetical protein